MIAEAEIEKPKKSQFHTEYPAPAWCRNVLRLVTAIRSVEGAVVGLKQGDRWITFTLGADSRPTGELVEMCDQVLAGELSMPAREGNGSDASSPRQAAGARLCDTEGRTVGALCVLASPGSDLDSEVGHLLAETASLVAPLTVAGTPNVTVPDAALASTDPSFLVRVLGKIQPLVSEIVAFSDVLQREVIGTSRKRAEIIHENGTRVVGTLKSVLDLIDLETMGVHLQPAVSDLAGIARDELEAHRQHVRTRGLRLNFEAADERMAAVVDEDSVRRVLALFLANAIEFTPEGGITMEVKKTVTHVEIAVIDTGRGIDAGFLPKIFEPFTVETEEDRRDGRGMGMGLALAKRLADQAGLDIVVESKQGSGSTFTLRCPLAMPESERLADSETGTNVRLDLSNKPLVLLLEDNEIARRVIEMMVRDEYDIVAASTADEALEYAREYQFDLLLLDIALNERRTGVEVLHGVRKIVRYHAVPAVACTAYSLPGLRERYLEAGFDGYIAKPFRARQLLETLDAALEQGRMKSRFEAFGGEVEINLPPLPATLPRLLELVSSEDGAEATKEVTQILMADPAASSWVLGHANSAFYSVRGQVGTVDRAVMLLGAEAISNLVIAGLVARALEDFDSDDVRKVHAYILNVSLGTAGFARELAQRLEYPNPELAFTAGMLHDMGRLFLLSHDPPGYAKLWLQNGTICPPELGQELLKMGLDHVGVGVDASKNWELPAELQAVVSSYEDPDRSLPRHRSLVSIVTAARAAAIELISRGDAEGSPTSGAPAGLLGKDLRRLETLHDVTPGDLRSLITERQEEVRSLLESMRAHA